MGKSILPNPLLFFYISSSNCIITKGLEFKSSPFDSLCVENIINKSILEQNYLKKKKKKVSKNLQTL